MHHRRARNAAAIILAASAVFATACNEDSVSAPRSAKSPNGPAFVITTTTTVWDFVGIAGGDGPQDNPATFSLPGLGSIVASGPSNLDPALEVHTKGFFDGAGTEERGLGFCRQYDFCISFHEYEIGDVWPDGANPSMVLDFTHLAQGTVVTAVTLASLQPGEGYAVYTSTDGNTYTQLSCCFGNENTEPTFTIAVPAGTKFMRFDVGNGVEGNNFLVQSVTTQTTTTSENPPCPAGSFSYSFANNGDLMIVYDQFPAPNDNSYGINAVGWPNGHKFSDLVGSDHAGFQLIDGGGVVRLSFNVDYLSALTSAPSGYASLGVTGGDGKMLVGTSTGISATTSLANNLNNINIPGLFDPTSHAQLKGSVNVLINSPPTDAAHQTYNNSDPALAGWDFHDTYFVTITAAKLASLGFDNTWKVVPNADQLHNSPAKPCPAGTGGGCPSATKYEVKDKQVKVTLTNSSSTDAILTDVALNWPSVTNGDLIQVKMDGDVVYDNPDISGGSAHLTTAQLVADINKRKINHNSSDVLTFIFKNNADTNLAHYTSTVKFGDDCTVNILPH